MKKNHSNLLSIEEDIVLVAGRDVESSLSADTATFSQSIQGVLDTELNHEFNVLGLEIKRQSLVGELFRGDHDVSELDVRESRSSI